jgi:hypothetical protein
MEGIYKSIDFRISALNQIMVGLSNSIEDFEQKEKDNYWYDGLFLLEDIEPIYGLAFIALQNYINSSIYDFDNSLNRKLELYKKDFKVKNSSKSKIELIICLANYFKHRDDYKELHKGTAIVL